MGAHVDSARNDVEPRRGRVLMITQVYVPDPAGVGQYMADVAAGLVETGVPVRVLTARRGYDDPSVEYPKRSVINGVAITRLPLASFGKRNLILRVIAQVSFLFQAVVVGLLSRRLDSVFVTASPPVGGAAALIISATRRVPITYWVMDINPDLAITSGQVKASSPFVRLLSLVDVRLLRRARVVITLDRHMAARLAKKVDLGVRLAVVSLWPLVRPPGERDSNDFALRHNPDDRFVVMYSGNHSLLNPLTTVLDSAKALAQDSRFRFLFVGGGVRKKEVDELAEGNLRDTVISLPYQPLESVSESLSAADIHVVTMGGEMVGLVHPSKVYNVLALGRPVLYIGPASHVTDLIEQHDVGWAFLHGDVDGVTRLLAELAADRSLAESAGRRAQGAMSTGHNSSYWRDKVVGLAVGTSDVGGET